MISKDKLTNNKDAFDRWLNRIYRPVDEDIRSAIWKEVPTNYPLNADGAIPREDVYSAFLDEVPISGRKFSQHFTEREHKESKLILVPWSERPEWPDWGPQKVEAYYQRRTPKLSTLDDDIATFSAQWGVKAETLPIQKISKRLPKTTNSGLPWLTANWFREVGPELIAEVTNSWRKDELREIPPSMPMFRQDPGKTRFAWAESKYEAVQGANFVYPLQDKMRTTPGTPFSAWNGPAHVENSLKRSLKRGKSDEYLSIDYSGYDQTQSPELVRRVYSDLLHPMLGSPKPKLFQGWLENLVAGPLVEPRGLSEFRLRDGEHGVPSGSIATNFIDTINNALCITGYINNYSISNSRYWCQGDDAVITGTGVDPNDFAEFALSEYGFEAHPDKQYFGHRECDYLRDSYYAENGFKATYPAARVAWRTIGHERRKYSGKQWNMWAVEVRTVQQLQNAINHPSIDELIRWTARGDKLDLGASLPPKTIFRNAGKVAKSIETERSAWDISKRENWDVLPIQGVIRKAISD
jgi:hypothetical protein